MGDITKNDIKGGLTIAGAVLLGYFMAKSCNGDVNQYISRNDKCKNKTEQVEDKCKQHEHYTPKPKSTKPKSPTTITPKNSELEKKVDELQQEVTELKTERKTQENYQSQNEVDLNNFRPLDDRIRRNPCYPNNVLVNASLFYNRGYGVLSYRGVMDGNMLMFYNMRTGYNVPLSMNQFAGMNWSVMWRPNIDETTLYGSNGYYPSVRYTNRPNRMQRFVNNNAMFSNRW